MMSENKNDSMTFEQATAALEKIVARLESGDVLLEESMQLFQEGMQLAEFCSKKLQLMEEKISQLIIQPDQSVEEVPLQGIESNNPTETA